MGMAMEERRYVWGLGVRLCIHISTHTEGDDVCCRGWSHAVAAVASIHHSQRLFVVACAPNEIFNLKSCLPAYNWLSVHRPMRNRLA